MTFNKRDILTISILIAVACVGPFLVVMLLVRQNEAKQETVWHSTDPHHSDDMLKLATNPITVHYITNRNSVLDLPHMQLGFTSKTLRYYYKGVIVWETNLTDAEIQALK